MTGAIRGCTLMHEIMLRTRNFSRILMFPRRPGHGDDRLHRRRFGRLLGVARYAPWLRPSGGKDVPKAAQLLQNPYIRNYWNPSGAFGRLLSQAVGLKNGDKQVYA